MSLERNVAEEPVWVWCLCGAIAGGFMGFVTWSLLRFVACDYNVGFGAIPGALSGGILRWTVSQVRGVERFAVAAAVGACVGVVEGCYFLFVGMLFTVPAGLVAGPFTVVLVRYRWLRVIAAVPVVLGLLGWCGP